ncbi:MAG: EboA domain-containing protein [Myxococcota bacterium]
MNLEGLSAGIDSSDIHFFQAFSQTRRRLGDAAHRPFSFTDEEQAALRSIYPGFEPSTWPLMTTARVWLMHGLSWARAPDLLNRLLQHAEIGEQIAIYRGLFTLQDPTVFSAQVAEGVRTNMVDVFDAIALNNPVAAWLLDDVGWTQLGLKAVFMDRPLYRIFGFDSRKTPQLAKAAYEYAHERWSAGRTIHPELWRLLAGISDHHMQSALQRARNDSDELTARAAGWALGERDSSAWPLGELPETEASGWLAIGLKAEARSAAAATRDVLYPSPKAS